MLTMKRSLMSIFIIILTLQSICFCQPHLIRQHNNEQIVQIAIIGSNDLHGTVFPKKLKRTDTGEQYNYGGLVYAASLIKIMKQEYKGRVLYLDAGDEFQGGIESSPQISKGQIMTDYFNYVGLDAAVLGNHQFDYSKQYLDEYLSKRNAPTILSDVFYQNTDVILQKQTPTKTFELDGIKIGVIGLVSRQSRLGTAGFLNKLFPQYEFPEDQQIVLKHSQRLRSEGVDIVLILSHMGNYCPQNSTFDVRTKDTQQQKCQNDELNKLLSKLPDGTVDGVVGGHRHQFMHHYYHDIPYMSSINGGYYFNVMHIVYNKKSRSIEKTKIEGPIPVCEKLFKNKKLCNYNNEEQLKSAGPLVRWKFHNQLVTADLGMKQIFDTKWSDKLVEYFQPIFETQILLERDLDQESSLANLITTMMALGAEQISNKKIDVAIINQGGFRSSWYPGSVNLKEYYSMFAFDDKLKQFQVTGKQLKQMLQITQKGQRGYYYCYGIKQTVRYTHKTDPNTGNPILIKYFINATLSDDSEIDDNKTFVMIALDFFTQGGDDFTKVLKGYTDTETNKVYPPIQLKNMVELGVSRQIVLKQLKKLQVIRKNQWGVNMDDPWINVIRD